MNLKEIYNLLVDDIQISYKQKRKRITKEEISQKLNISRTYFSALLGGSEEVKQHHIDDLKLKFKDELSGNPLSNSDIQQWQTKDENNQQPKNQIERLLEIIEKQNEIIDQQQQTINQLIATSRNVTLPTSKTGSA